MHDNWREIADFPGYSVLNTGHIRNDNTERLMRLSVNQRGIQYVGLMRDGIQHKTSVPQLVAKAHIPKPRLETFGSVINLDGDRTNNNANNLEWRPRWFSTMYFKQFEDDPLIPFGPIEDINTNELYKTSWEAAVTHGLIDLHIRLAIKANQPVWPTYQIFRRI